MAKLSKLNVSKTEETLKCKLLLEDNMVSLFEWSQSIYKTNFSNWMCDWWFNNLEWFIMDFGLTNN